jgi:hypothetical protein
MLPEKTKTQRPMTNNKTSMTLVELIMASVILCVIIAGIGVVMNLSIRAYDFVTTETSKQGNVKVATEHLLKYIKNSSYCKAVDGTTLALYGRSHESLGTYTVSSDKKLIFTKPTGNPQIISENTLLTFTEAAGYPGEAREVRIDFSQPINQTTYISCRLTLPNTWAKTFDIYNNDGGVSVQPTSDGGYIVTGSTTSYSEAKTYAYLIKTDGNGNHQWTKTFDKGIDETHGYYTQQTSDGGYIITGYTRHRSTSSENMFLIKTDEYGEEEWSKIFSKGTIAESLQQTSDEGYIIAGWVRSGNEGDIILIKTNEYGGQQWERRFGGNKTDIASFVRQTSEGGYIILGNTGSFGAGMSDFYLLKTNEYGEELWSKTFGGPSSDNAQSVQQTSDGGYIMAGYTGSFGAGNWDGYVVKTDEFGEEKWSRTFGGSGDDRIFSVQQSYDGGYILAGSSSLDVYVIKTDEAGKEEWSNTFGDAGIDYASFVLQTTDRGYIAVGGTNSFGAGYFYWDIYLIKIDSQGNCPQAASPTAVPDEPTAEFGTPTSESATPEHDSSIPEHENAVPVHDPGAPS